jgi:hypothetical protein
MYIVTQAVYIWEQVGIYLGFSNRSIAFRDSLKPELLRSRVFIVMIRPPTLTTCP